MLALRIRQKNATFYFATLQARKILDRVRFVSRFYFEGEEIPAESKPEDEISRFIARIERSDSAFQRPLKRRKVRDLVHFYESVSEQPAIPGTILLATREVLKFEPIRENFGSLSEPREKFDIIDGQHRLAGLHFFARHLENQGKAGELDTIEVPLLIFDGRSADHAAEMFVTINATQTRISRSHLIDLLEKVTLASTEERFAADLVKLLYREDSSPLQYRINMLGGRSQLEKWILQSEVFNELLRLVGGKERKPTPLRKLFVDRWNWKRDRAFHLLVDYLKATREVFSDAWGNRTYQVTSSVVLKALLRALPTVLEDPRVIDRWEREGSAAVFLERLRPWGALKESLRTEGFFNRYPAKGQLERVRLIQKELESRLRS